MKKNEKKFEKKQEERKKIKISATGTRHPM